MLKVDNSKLVIDMDKNCDKTRTLNGDKLPGTFFSLSSGNYQENLNCFLTIKAPTQNQRIILVIDKMDISCEGDTIKIYDGKIDTTTILNKNQSQQCGTTKSYFRVSRISFRSHTSSDKRMRKTRVYNIRRNKSSKTRNDVFVL